MLKVNDLKVVYNGNIKALKGVNLEVNKGEIVVLIGANGAGKTTLLRALTGLTKAESESSAILDLSELTDKRTLNRLAGPKLTDKLLKTYGESDIVFDKIRSEENIETEVFGKTTFINRKRINGLRKKYNEYIKTDLLKLPAYRAVDYGVAHVPEGRQIFVGMTIQENLEMGAYKRHNIIKIKKDLEEIYKLFPRLEERKKQKAGTLSGGEQQMLAMARAMISKPKILLLDEPSMGLSPIFVSEIFSIIKALNKNGTTILLVEQNAKAALSIADRGYVIETGNIVLEGTGKELLENDKVKDAYLGA